MPAMPAAETATINEVKGEGDDKTSSPPAYVNAEDNWTDRPGSGRARRAERKDRVKDVIVDKSME